MSGSMTSSTTTSGRELGNRRNRTVVVTHDSAVAKRAQRRLHIKQGRVTQKM